LLLVNTHILFSLCHVFSLRLVYLKIMKSKYVIHFSVVLCKYPFFILSLLIENIFFHIGYSLVILRSLLRERECKGGHLFIASIKHFSVQGFIGCYSDSFNTSIFSLKISIVIFLLSWCVICILLLKVSFFVCRA